MAVYVGSFTVINDFNSNYKMLSYGNNVVTDCTNIYLWGIYGVNYNCKVLETCSTVGE